MHTYTHQALKKRETEVVDVVEDIHTLIYAYIYTHQALKKREIEVVDIVEGIHTLIHAYIYTPGLEKERDRGCGYSRGHFVERLRSEIWRRRSYLIQVMYVCICMCMYVCMCVYKHGDEGPTSFR